MKNYYWFRFFVFIVLFCASTHAEEVPGEDLDVLLKSFNRTMQELGGCETSKEQLRVAILDGLINEGAPKKFQNPEAVKRYINCLVSSDKLPLSTNVSKVLEGDVYVFRKENKDEFRVTGPSRWKVTIQIQFLTSGPMADWIEVPIVSIPEKTNPMPNK